MISYAQNFEDVILARLFPDRKTGFYIDVGAGDPSEDSVTRHFYDLGWNGINIEPHHERFAQLAAARPRDINLALAISSRAGTETFYEREAWGLSSLTMESPTLETDVGKIIKTYEVNIETLAQVCAEHVGTRTIDFLKIDAEGAERDVIAGMDFAKYPASVVLVEATRPNTQVSNHDQWEEFLLAAGYTFAYFDGLNRFYLDAASQHLRPTLSLPPNVFDNFVKASEMYYRDLYEDVAGIRQPAEGVLRRDRAERRALAQTLQRERAERVNVIRKAEHEHAELRNALRQEQDDKAALKQALGIERLAATATKRSMEQSAYILAHERFQRRRAEVLSLWNAVQRRQAVVAAQRQVSLVAYGKRRARQILHAVTRLRAGYRRSFDILAQHLGTDGTEAIYQTPFASISMRGLHRITRSPFWQDVVLPLEKGRAGLFDSTYYLERSIDVRNEEISPLRHYVLFGAAEGRMPHPLFDGTWYLSRYSDVTTSGLNPLWHFANSGGAEGRMPHPAFDSGWYLEQNPDVRAAGMNPLTHYLSVGALDGRDPNPLFDTDWYIGQHPALAASGVNPLAHYLTEGAKSGCNPNPLFDTAWYLAQNPDVAAAGTNPLVHYLIQGAAEGRNPNQLFDTGWYLAQNPDAAGVNPLVHYLTVGGPAGRDPHPLFDGAWYLKRYPDVAAAGISPIVHFLKWGGREGRDPNPLFDTKWYREQNPDVAAAGVIPVVHFFTMGFREGRDPNPLFDTDWYLAQNPDVAADGINPLVHYLAEGAGAGRDPNPLFDTDWYLAQNPKVAAAGTNPLVHYLAEGAAAGRDPSPLFRTERYLGQHPEVAAQGLSALAHHLTRATAEGRSLAFPSIEPGVDAGPRYRITDLSEGGRRAAPSSKPLVVCISHVLPWPPRAGNEYRIARILDWLSSRGHDLLIVVAPMAGLELEPGEQHLKELVGKYRNAAICHRDGRVLTSVNSIGLSLKSLDGRSVIGNFKALERSSNFPESSLHETERQWCHEALVGLLAEIGRQVENPVYYINYAFMTRFLAFLPRPGRSFVDTLDIFSQKTRKVTNFGLTNEVVMAPEDERRLLERADAVVAIHRSDAIELGALVPGTPVVSAGVDFSVIDVGDPPPRPSILLVAHNNALNVKGANDFLRFAWPAIKREVPGVTFVIVGRVGEAVRTEDPQIKIAGVVDSLEPYYRDCRVVVNPAVAGTGLKVKTVESIAYFRSIVTWPHGIDGIDPPLLQFCNVAHNWHEFARKTIVLLSPGDKLNLSRDDRDSIKHALEANAVYAELGAWLDGRPLLCN